MACRLVPLVEADLEIVADVLRRGFADYFVPIPFDRALLLNMIAHDGMAPALSRLVLRDEDPVGCAMIARRGWTSRLAGMAIVPEARGQGVGRSVMDDLIEQARERGDRRIVLEVIEQNEPAVRLYEACGFTRIRRLVSLQLESPALGSQAELQEIDIREVARIVTQHGLPDLPWQLSGESLVLSSPPMRAYRLGPAAVVVSNPDAERIAILSLIVDPEERGRGHAKRLLQAVLAAYPEKTWRVPALCPQEAAAPFTGVGFEFGELSQWQMALGLV